MGNLNVSGQQHVPVGQRVSKEATKAQAQEKLNSTVKAIAAVSGSGTAAAAAVSLAAHQGVAGVGIGALVGGAIGGLMGGIVLKLPNNKAYTIQEGDNLTNIAKKELGPTASPKEVEAFINKILDLNEDVIDNPHRIYTGDTIALPANQHGKANTVQGFVD